MGISGAGDDGDDGFVAVDKWIRKESNRSSRNQKMNAMRLKMDGLIVTIVTRQDLTRVHGCFW